MARNSADVVDHEIDAKLSADDHEQNEADALAAINASWFDDSERTDVLEARHLLSQLVPQPRAASESHKREPESEQRPIQRRSDPQPTAADPMWDDASERTLASDLDQLAPWEEPDLTGAAEWEEAKTEYFERSTSFELLDSTFVSESTDRLPGGLRELLSSDAESAVAAPPRPRRKSGVRESARVVPTPTARDDAPDLRAPSAREVSAEFAYHVSPEVQPAPARPKQSVPASSRPTVSRNSRPANSGSKRRTGSQTLRERGRTPAPAQPLTSDPLDFDSDSLSFDEASVATARGGRRFAPKSEAPAQRASVAPSPTAAPQKLARTTVSQRAAPAPQSPASQPTTTPTYDTDSLRPLVARSTRPSIPSQPGALPVAAEYDTDFAELSDHRRQQTAAWIWFAASALSGVALILVIRAWTTTPMPVAQAPQEPSVAVETTVSAALPSETGFSITSEPEGAQILVDGKPTGFLTPASVKRLSPGLHSVELKLDGYYDTTLPAALEESTTLELAPVAMRPHPSEPVAAAAPVGTILPQLKAATRSHARGRETRRSQRRGITRNAPVRALNDRDGDRASEDDGAGTLRINSRPWARVLVDNKFAGNTPQRALKVAAGEHSVRLVNEALNMSKTIRVTVRDGETVTRVEMLNEDTDQSRIWHASSGDAAAKADR